VQASNLNNLHAQHSPSRQTPLLTIREKMSLYDRRQEDVP
jgi:hypothetical protein